MKANERKENQALTVHHLGDVARSFVKEKLYFVWIEPLISQRIHRFCQLLDEESAAYKSEILTNEQALRVLLIFYKIFSL